ncbi:MAG: hypothetical protein Q4G18_00375 [Myroides sp.]|nr:hypothetical protein [Myroides sp.]
MGKALSYVGQLVILGLISLGLHFLIQSITKDLALWDTAYMTLWQIYALQMLMSIIIVFAVVGIGQSMPQNLGYVFLGFLTLKLVINYLLINPALESGNESDFFKYNYLGVFFLFMIFDVYVTYRVLNQSYPQKNN